jgi:hypothetical protein
MTFCRGAEIGPQWESSMSSNATRLSETRRNRFSLRLFAALLALALCAFVLPRSASAENCVDAFANWSTGSHLVHSVTGSSTYAHEIDEWDSDVVKVRHNISGLLIIGAKGVAIKGDLYFWNPSTEEIDQIDVEQELGGGSGNVFTTEVEVGDYCFEIASEEEGGYELNINFLDGCTLGILSPLYCSAPEE